MRNPVSSIGAKLEGGVLAPLTHVLHERLGLSPNNVSVLSFAAGTAAVWLLATSQYSAAMVWLLISLILDGLDGAIARRYDLRTKLGEILELVFDRLNEAMLFLALVYSDDVDLGLALLCIVAIGLMTSLRKQADFDPGLKRIMLFVGFVLSDYQLALQIVFFANLFGFAFNTLRIDYKEQKIMDMQ